MRSCQRLKTSHGKNEFESCLRKYFCEYCYPGWVCFVSPQDSVSCLMLHSWSWSHDRPFGTTSPLVLALSPAFCPCFSCIICACVFICPCVVLVSPAAAATKMRPKLPHTTSRCRPMPPPPDSPPSKRILPPLLPPEIIRQTSSLPTVRSANNQ